MTLKAKVNEGVPFLSVVLGGVKPFIIGDAKFLAFDEIGDDVERVVTALALVEAFVAGAESMTQFLASVDVFFLPAG